MIKYVEYDAFDEHGQHIIPINNLYQMNKTASGTYSPELMKIILNMKRRQDRYYVVVNALGSHEIWGCNRNGDSFPESGLTHKSLRTDMGTANDYGYKTFEYYAKLYKHHVNKDPNNSFGEIIFSHWNPVIHRVELIIAIDVEKAKDIIDALDKQEQVSVSMGCFTNPEYPILTIDGYKPIKDIKVDDLVFTHKGNWKKVTELHRRKYTGKIYKVELRGLPIPLELTADHPMMMKCFQKTSLNKERSYINPQQFESKQFDWTHIEHSEIGDHIQYLPVKYSEYGLSSISDEKLAKLMGYYFAEGSFIYNDGVPCTIQLSCHIDDDLPREVPKLINELFPQTTCSIRSHHNSNKGLSVDIHSTRLACFMDKYMSHLSHDKKIPAEIFISDKNIKLSFIGSWISGDGFCDNKGVHISSCNLNALLQARDLLISCDIASSLYKINHKAGSGLSTNETIEYTLNISHIDAEPLIPYCNKKLSGLYQYISKREKEGNTAIRFNADGTFSYSIKSVEFTEVENIQTYNFEVEDDESYIAAGLVSHNCKVKYDRCSICGNKASTRASYCKHLTDHMREIVSNEQAKKWSIETGKNIIPGMQVFAFNDYPRFFDLSRVYVGADRTSYVLGKAASKGHIFFSVDMADAKGVTDAMIDKIASVGKTSEIEKELGGAVSPSDIDDPENKNNNDGVMVKSDEMTAIKKSLDEKINNTIAIEPALPNSFLDPVAKSLPLETIFSTLFGLGIHPKPEEFQRIVLIKINQKPLADELERQNLVFNHNDDNIEPTPIDISENYFSDTLGRGLASILPDRSCFPSMLGPRMQIAIIKTAQDNSLFPNPRKIDPGLTILEGIAALYAGLKLKAMGYGPKELASIFANKAWLLPMIGGSVMWKVYDEIDKKNTKQQMIPAKDYANILQNTHFSGHIKQAAVSIPSLGNATGTGLLAAAVTLPAAYIANAWNQKSKQTTGSELFPGAGTNPITAATVAGVGTGGLSYGMRHGVKGLYESGKGATNVIKNGIIKVLKSK